MGWDNPPVPWRELERRMSWRSAGQEAEARQHTETGQRTGPSQQTGPRRRPAALRRADSIPPAAGSLPWAELHCHSSFSFLDGAATPAELAAEAARLGLTALAITDHDGMYGVPQFAQAAARLADRAVR